MFQRIVDKCHNLILVEENRHHERNVLTDPLITTRITIFHNHEHRTFYSIQFRPNLLYRQLKRVSKFAKIKIEFL
jgi:hypothetical protein